MPNVANIPVPNVQSPNVSNGMTIAQILASCESSMPISIQSAYAGMQLAQAKLCRDQSQKKMDAMQEIQGKQSKIADMISKYRASGNFMSEEMIKEMKALGLSTNPANANERWFEIKPGPEMDKLIEKFQKAWDCAKEGSTARKWLDDWLPALKNHRAEGKPFTLSPENFKNLQAVTQHIASNIKNASDGMVDIFTTAVGKGYQGATLDKEMQEYNLKSMTNFQEQVGTKVQSTMVTLQDFIGQYNAYLQGANAAIDKANQLLAKLASGQQ